MDVFQASINFIIAFGTLSFFATLFIPGTYGKFFRPWIWTIDGKLGWLFFESVPWIIFSLSFGDLTVVSTPALILFSLWMIHYLHRSLVYTYFAPSMSSTNIVIIVMATAFNIPNGYVNGFAASVTQSDRIYDWKFWAGIAVFAIGMAINISADYTLFALRRKKVNEKGHQKYFIPYGFMFEYVSSANYLGEIIEWTGWAIACGNPAAYSFMFFTMANLVPRALSTHKFYKDTFKTAYPTSRKAIIPFLL